MAAEALLHDLTDSPFCAKARICLAVKGVSFRRLTLTVRGLRRLRALNPLGRVPVLEHDGRVIADSTAIAHYLEERFPEPSLLPADPAARAYCALVEDWADESLSFVVGAFRWLNPQNRAVAQRAIIRELGGGPPVGWIIARRVRRRYRSAGWSASSLAHFDERLRADLRMLAGLLDDRAFLLGRSLTLADVSAFVQLRGLERCAEEPVLDAEPAVARWMQRVRSVPAVTRALAA
jgi:glutathione S-transferase